MFSFAGDTVLDPFLGTGSTAIAAAEAGRNSIGLDIEPAYVEMALSNAAKATQKQRAAGAIGATLIQPARSKQHA